MPEEKKKESFTFSDKIKQSKQPASKSFANRFTSKIGSDGKPHQTLFERTKRDAPFFIAALVALLLLPFLYKYSGQVEDEPTMVTPSYDDAILNPDRSGFDFTGTDPEGQIAQLSGRDSMDLIVGFGKRHSNDEESADSLDEIYRNGLSDSSSADSSYVRNDMDEENNTTNIYKVRKKAPAQTRAAFKRAQTKINKLGNGGISRPNGGKLGVGMWGGNLKSAANKVRSAGPQNSPKPVSLQPLQAAGKPSRSYFGGGAAREAQRSKDAMSKSNAMQALMDAQMKQPEPGQFGGVMGGDFGGPGGGNGNLHREFNYKGEKPWWWDLMKTRAQMQWEAHFKRMWKYIDALDDVLINIGKGLLNCLATGNSDGDVDHFFGTSEGSTSGKRECCGVNESKWKNNQYFKDVPFNKDVCKANIGRVKEEFGKSNCSPEWKDTSSSSSTRQGFVGVRLGCLGLNLGRIKQAIKDEFSPAQGDLTSGTSCETFMRDGKYEPALMVDNVHKNVWGKTRDDASKWDIWIYIVGIQAGDLDKYYKVQPDQKEDMLKILYLGHRDAYEAGEVGDRQLGSNDIPLFIESAAILGSRKLGDVSSSSKSSGSKAGASSQEEQQLRSDLSSWENKLTRAKTDAERKQCHEMITNIQTRLAQIGRTQSQQKGSSAAVSSDGKDGPDMNKARVGMSYKEFLKVLANGGAIVSRDDEAGNPTEYRELKGSKKGKYFVTGGRCNYPYARISCDVHGKVDEGNQDGKGRPVAYLQFYNGMTQEQAYNKMKDRFVVSYQILGANGAPAEEVTSTEKADKTQWIPLGTQNFSQDENGRTVIAAEHSVTNLKTEGRTRVGITWQIRQCADVSFNGDSVSKGGCNVGKVSRTDKEGQVSWYGQDVPGIVVSEASCFYDSSEVVTHNPGKVECEGDQTVDLPLAEGEKCVREKYCNNGKWAVRKKDASCREDEPQLDERGNPQPAPRSVDLFDSLDKISAKPLDPNERPDATSKKWSSCKVEGGRSLLKLDNETKAYFTAAKQKFDERNKDAKVTLSFDETWEALTIANLVDAILIDPKNGTVPANTVCLLGKSIGGWAQAPAHGDQYDNLFGAFLAFITYDAVARPTQKTYHHQDGRRKDDLRFGWSTKDYWWGGYMDVGDRSYYVNQIDTGMWQGLPLNELEREKLPAYSKTRLKHSDNKNRKDFQRIYDDLTNNEPCKYASGSNVTQAKVLEYITRLCENGDNVMPKASDKIYQKYKGAANTDQEATARGDQTPHTAPSR